MADRDPATGKFLPGNKASPGRPPRRVEDAFQDAISAAVSKYAEGIGKAMVKEALLGDVPAARFLAEYTIGKPPQILELRAADAVLLREVLTRFEARGLEASDVFNALLAELAAEESEVDQDGR